MNTDLIKKVKNTIYSKPHKSYYTQFYNISKNFNNNILFNLLDDNEIDNDNDKNVMISELDIKLNNSQSRSIDKKESDKQNIINKNNESKNEFKKQLTENIIKFLQKNKDNSFNDRICNKNDLIEKTKKSLNLTSIASTNKHFKTININKNDNEKKIKKNKYFIKINKKINMIKIITKKKNF